MQNQLFNTIFRAIFPHKSSVEVKKIYRLPQTLDLNFRLTSDGWLVVTSSSLPGFLTQAKNQDELIEMVNDAALSYFDVPRREADIVYDQLKLGDQIIQYKGQLVTKAA